MADQKTKPTTLSPDDFIDKLPSESVRDDCRVLVKMMQKVTGEPAVMWGPSIIGFGKYRYKYASGHEGYSAVAGFSPRKTDLTVYCYPKDQALLKKLGKHKASKACLYIKRLSDVDLKVLEKLVSLAVKDVRAKYPD